MTIPKMLGAMCLMCCLAACGEKPSDAPTPAAPASNQQSDTNTKSDNPPQGEQTQTAAPPAQESATDANEVEPAKASETQTDIDKAAKDDFEAVVAAADKLPSDAGLKRYEATCNMCHTQALLNAPKIGDKAAWSTRIAKGRQTLYTHSANGFNQMPAQVVGDVSKEEVLASVDYIISKSS